MLLVRENRISAEARLSVVTCEHSAICTLVLEEVQRLLLDGRSRCRLAKVPTEACLAARLGLGAHIAPSLLLNRRGFGIQGIQVQREAFICTGRGSPIPEIILSVTLIEEQRKGSGVIGAPGCS